MMRSIMQFCANLLLFVAAALFAAWKMTELAVSTALLASGVIVLRGVPHVFPTGGVYAQANYVAAGAVSILTVALVLVIVWYSRESLLRFRTSFQKRWYTA